MTDQKNLDESINSFLDSFLKLVELVANGGKNYELASEVCSKLDKVVLLSDDLLEYDVSETVKVFKDSILEPYREDKFACENRWDLLKSAFIGSAFVKFIEHFSGRLGENAADGASDTFRNFINPKGTIMQEIDRKQINSQKPDESYVIPESVIGLVNPDGNFDNRVEKIKLMVKEKPLYVTKNESSTILKKFEKTLQQPKLADNQK